MKKVLNILYLEDDYLDVKLVESTLANENLKHNLIHVDSKQSFKIAMKNNSIDLILADYKLPTFDGMMALEMSKKLYPDLPFIFVSGAMGEEVAIETLKNGATDYVLKDNLIRLVPSIQRAIKEVKNQQENRQLEMSIQEYKMMKAISCLAGGIAHQFNNSLAALSGNVELLRMDLSDQQNACRYTGRMMKSIEKMAGLTDQLLAYAEGGKYQPKALSLDNFFQNSLPLILSTINPSIHIKTNMSPNIKNIKSDQTQLQMIMTDLISNAAEAIEGKGHIKISAKNVNVGSEMIKKYSWLKSGSFVCIKIQDTGKGMEKETLKRIFEPFFTTHFQGRGLGLAAVYGIIKNHNGWIDVNSQVGKGTTVRVCLPAVDTPTELHQEKEPINTAENTTVLLIEDESMVIDVCEKILHKLGYQTLVAETGKQAIYIANNHKEKIDIALLDISLPDMSGTSVYPFLIKARPDLKVIVCSGYSIDGPASEILNAGAQSFLQKPYTMEAFSRKLNELIERRKLKRYKAMAGVEVIPAFVPFKHFQIIDINNTGLAFCYDESNGKIETFSEVTIKGPDCNFGKIQCKIVSDSKLDNTLSLSENSDAKQMKRLGLQFKNITLEQANRFDFFFRK